MLNFKTLESSNAYEIFYDDNQNSKAIHCKVCLKSSYNQNDVKNYYCGSCKAFHKDRAALPPLIVDRYNSVVVRKQTQDIARTIDSLKRFRYDLCDAMETNVVLRLNDTITDLENLKQRLKAALSEVANGV